MVLDVCRYSNFTYHSSFGHAKPLWMGRSFSEGIFQVASIHTSCGFATDDYNVWPHFTWMLLIYTMFAGGCTGSTGGGIKNMRLLILFRNMKNEFSRLIHPRAVLPVKVNQQALSLSTISTVNTFILLYLICIL